MSQLDKTGKERPIAFFSKAKKRKTLTKTRELELYAFLLVCRKWRQYLYGKKFVWRTDHKPLKWEELNPCKKVATWLEELRDYDYSTEYVQGSTNIVADTLSRQPYKISRVGMDSQARIAVPKGEIHTILKQFHDNQGHQPYSYLIHKVRERFYWQGMSADIRAYCENCPTCLMSAESKMGQGMIELTSQPEKPWEEVAMDLVKVEEGYLLVIVDLFSRYLEVDLLPNKTATTVSESFQRIFLYRHGLPHSLLTDTGLEFTGMQGLSSETGFDWKRISPGNPRSNGCCERTIRHS